MIWKPRRINRRVVIDIASGRVEKRDSYIHRGPVALLHNNPAFDLTDYAFYQDDAGESSSTIIGTANNQQTLDTGKIYQCRMLQAETDGGARTGAAFQCEFYHTEGTATWTNITTTSSVVEAINSPWLSDLGATSQRLGAGTFISTNDLITEDGLTGGGTNYAGSDECEIVLAFRIIAADVSHGDEILIRCSNTNGDTQVHTVTADIDVNLVIGSAGLRTLGLTGAGL